MRRDTYLALGDSITAGFGARGPAVGFGLPLAQRLRDEGLASGYWMVARSGWTTRQLLTALVHMPKAVWPRIRVVTLCIGGNDLRRLLTRRLLAADTPWSHEQIRPTIVDASYRLNELCTFIRDQEIPYVSLATLYNPAPESPFAAEVIQDINEVIRNCAKRYDFRLTDLNAAFHQREPTLIHGFRRGRLQDLMVPFSRPIHPNHRGVQVICNEFMKTLKMPVRRPTSKSPSQGTTTGSKQKRPRTRHHNDSA